MTTELQPQRERSQVREQGESHDWIRGGIQVVVSSLLTLLVLLPIAYTMHRSQPPHLGTVDLQTLLQENQSRVMAVIGDGDNITQAQRDVAQKLAADFARRLSDGVRELSAECGCILVNKAALLGGDAVDYTEQVRARLK